MVYVNTKWKVDGNCSFLFFRSVGASKMCNIKIGMKKIIDIQLFGYKLQRHPHLKLPQTYAILKYELHICANWLCVFFAHIHKTCYKLNYKQYTNQLHRVPLTLNLIWPFWLLNLDYCYQKLAPLLLLD